MQERVSVIVPIYNVEPYLKQCLDSLLAQVHENLEVLLVDDCSTDRSAAIAKEYAQTHSERFRFIQREENGGLSAARNTGMAAATGDWLAFVDSDDWVTENYISAMYAVAQKDHADIVMSSLYYYYPDGKCKEMSPFGGLTTQSSHQEKVALSRPYACTKLFRRSLIVGNNIAFPENIKRSEDIPTIIPLLCATEHISILSQPLYYYLQRTTSLSNQNYQGMDLSFYPQVINKMFALSPSGFEKELEFRATSDLMYGMIMLMVRSKKPKLDIMQQIGSFNQEFPKWQLNPYLARLPRGKRIFIWFAAHKQLWVLKALIAAWDIKQILKH